MASDLENYILVIVTISGLTVLLILFGCVLRRYCRALHMRKNARSAPVHPPVVYTLDTQPRPVVASYVETRPAESYALSQHVGGGKLSRSAELDIQRNLAMAKNGWSQPSNPSGQTSTWRDQYPPTPPSPSQASQIDYNPASTQPALQMYPAFPPSAPAPPPPTNLVKCPVCSVEMPQRDVNRHLDACLVAAC